MDLRKNKALTPVDSGFPISAITIDLTTRCPLACDYCFSGVCKEYQAKDLTPEMGKKIIDWLFLKSTHGDSKELDISYWGGEPLLKWDLMKELTLYAEEKAKEAGVRVIFGGTTNVVLLTPDKFDFLDEHNIRFLLSIDGTQEHHDRHRKFRNGKGSWEVVDRNATEILKRWPDSQVRLSYSVENLDGIIDDLNYLYDKGFHDIVYSPVSEGNWTEERLEKLKEMWDKIADWYIEKRKAGKPIRLKFLEDACRHLNGQPCGPSSPCGAGRGYVCITTEGAIYPCVKPETLVRTSSGMKQIKDITEGEYVLTHTGQYQEVTKLWTKPYDGIMYKITPYYFNIPIEFTPDHPVYAIKGSEYKCWHDRYKPDCTRTNKTECKYKFYQDYNAQWIDAKDITTKDFLIYPINRTICNIPTFSIETEGQAKYISEFTPDADLMYLLGWYVAEGHTQYGQTIFTLSPYEKDIAEKLNEICLKTFGISGRISEEDNKVRLIILSVGLAKWFEEQFGKDALCKKLPDWIMTAPPELQLYLIRGMFYGDGGNDRGKSAFYRTISADLANQMKELLLRQNTVPAIRIYKPSRHKDGIEQQREYRVYVWNTDDCKKLFSDHWVFKEKVGKKSRKLGWIDGDYLYLAVRKVETVQYTGRVYNLEVANDNSYTLESICCHNCHRFHKMDLDDVIPWYEQETCLGHIDYGILNQEWREKFTKWDPRKDLPESCHSCKAYLVTCCGGCWATNWDINKALNKVPYMNCVAELATIAQAEKVARELGEGYVRSLVGIPGRISSLPPAQGCQCYNVHDDLYGRQVVNRSDPYSCLCNMSTYGIRPEPIRGCDCYNVIDNARGYDRGYFDMSGATCRRFQRSPLDDAIQYLENISDRLDKLTQEEMEKINRFMNLKMEVDAKEKEFETLQNITESIEK